MCGCWADARVWRLGGRACVAAGRTRVWRRGGLACVWRARRVDVRRPVRHATRTDGVASRRAVGLKRSPRPGRTISPPRADRRRARESGLPRRAMNRRGADLGPRRDRPWTAPWAVMTELPAVRVLARGGGRGRRGCLTQGDELQGRIHGPAHQRSERALLRSAVGHRGEHVFGNLRRASDGNTRKVRDPEAGKRGSHAPERNPRGQSAIDLAGPRAAPARTPSVISEGREARRRVARARAGTRAAGGSRAGRDARRRVAGGPGAHCRWLARGPGRALYPSSLRRAHSSSLAS